LSVNCKTKETSLRLYEKEPVMCKLQEFFRSGLNEMKLSTITHISNSSLLFKRVAVT